MKNEVLKKLGKIYIAGYEIIDNYNIKRIEEDKSYKNTVSGMHPPCIWLGKPTAFFRVIKNFKNNFIAFGFQNFVGTGSPYITSVYFVDKKLEEVGSLLTKELENLKFVGKYFKHESGKFFQNYEYGNFYPVNVLFENNKLAVLEHEKLSDKPFIIIKNKKEKPSYVEETPSNINTTPEKLLELTIESFNQLTDDYFVLNNLEKILKSRTTNVVGTNKNTKEEKKLTQLLKEAIQDFKLSINQEEELEV